MKALWWFLGIFATAIVWAWSTDWYEKRQTAAVAATVATQPAGPGPTPLAS